MKDKLIIIGANGHGRVVADIAIKMNRWRDVQFLDDNETVKSSMGLEVVGLSSAAQEYVDKYDIFVGIGNNVIRKRFLQKLEYSGASIPVLIHPNAIIGKEVTFEPGTVVMAGVVINSYTKIGRGCIINTSATIDHDNLIEDFVHISPGVHLAGTVKIGQGSWLGIGSLVSNNITVTSGCKIGAGAVVVKDISEAGTYLGVPARRQLNEGITDSKNK